MITKERYGPWAVIAGGSEGMADAYARTLAAAGLNLVLIARRAEPLEALAADVRKAHRIEVRTLVLDLARPDMLARVQKITDDVDVGLLIVNAGGIGLGRAFLKQTHDELLEPIQLNAIGPALLAHHFGGKMAARRRGGIILVSSLAANAGISNIATYCGAKAFVQVFGEALWAEMRPHGVDVLVLVPPATGTPARARTGHSTAGVTPVDPAVVAQEALDNLASGPVHISPSGVEFFTSIRAMPRRQAAEAMNKAMTARE